MKIRAIVTGVTGMVGEGVLHECLLHPDVEAVLVITRKGTGVKHAKVKEILLDNFLDLSAIENSLTGYNACFFCLGVTSLGKNKNLYHHLTYDLTLYVAETVSRLNNNLTFCYVSGVGSDSTEQGKTMWARVKGKTENALLLLPFTKAYMFRPGYIQPTKGLSNTLKGYKFLSWLYPVWKTLLPKYVCTLREVGLAMINIVRIGYEKQLIEVKDIVILAAKK